jgi:hypothetical protein
MKSLQQLALAIVIAVTVLCGSAFPQTVKCINITDFMTYPKDRQETLCTSTVGSSGTTNYTFHYTSIAETGIEEITFAVYPQKLDLHNRNMKEYEAIAEEVNCESDAPSAITRGSKKEKQAKMAEYVQTCIDNKIEKIRSANILYDAQHPKQPPIAETCISDAKMLVDAKEQAKALSECSPAKVTQ